MCLFFTFKKNMRQLINIILKSVAMAMAVAIVVLTAIGNLDTQTGFQLVGIGLFCLALSSMK